MARLKQVEHAFFEQCHPLLQITRSHQLDDVVSTGPRLIIFDALFQNCFRVVATTIVRVTTASQKLIDMTCKHVIIIIVNGKKCKCNLLIDFNTLLDHAVINLGRQAVHLEKIIWHLALIAILLLFLRSLGSILYLFICAIYRCADVDIFIWQP